MILSPTVRIRASTETIVGIATGLTSNLESTARWSEVHGENPIETSAPPFSPTISLESVFDGPPA